MITPAITSTVENAITVTNVHDYVDLPGVGRVYRGAVAVATLARLIDYGVIKYAPSYQRGFKKPAENPLEYEPLQPLTAPVVAIKLKRAEEMAVKYLQGKLYSTGVIWNARKEEGEPGPEWDDKSRTLRIFTQITVPDTAHRHLNYRLLNLWHRHPDQVPHTIVVNDKPIFREEIMRLLDRFNPAKSTVFVEIYHLSPIEEGWLFDQFNNDARPPDRAVGIQLNRQKTPSRRFIDTLMNTSPIFSEHEVETRSNTIGSESRKLTTISTLAAAAEEPAIKRLLIELEGSTKQADYTDLVEFFGEFFKEYARVFPAFQPSTSVEERNAMRKESLAIANVMFHPLFRLAAELWRAYRDRKLDWRGQNEWKKAIARMDSPVVGPKGERLRLMSRDNPTWVGKVLIERWGPEGVIGVNLSNTRQTRQAAYQYLLDETGLGEFLYPDTNGPTRRRSRS